MVNDSFQMPSPFISREETFVTKKPSFARNVSFRVVRNPPACLIKGSLHTTTLMSACVGKVPVFLHRHTCKRTSGCLTATSATQCGRALVSHQRSRALVSCNINFLSRLTMKSITCKIASYRASYGKFTTNNDKLW